MIDTPADPRRRRLLQASLAASTLTLVPPAITARTAAFDAVVAIAPRDGVRTFASVGDAVAAARLERDLQRAVRDRAVQRGLHR